MRLQSFIASTMECAIHLLDVRGNVESWNAGSCAILGYPADEILGRPYAVFFDRDDVRHEIPGTLLERAVGYDRAEDEGWRLRADGTRFWAHAVLTALRGDEGEVVGLVEVIRDLTERRMLEDRQQRQQERELRRLREVIALQSELALAPSELDDRLALVVERAQWLTRADGAFIEQRNGTGVTLRAASGTARTRGDHGWPLERSFARLAPLGPSLLVADVSNDELAPSVACAELRVRSFAMARVRVHGETAGAVVVTSSDLAAFDAADAALLELVANLVGATLEKDAARIETKRLEERIALTERLASLGTLAAGVAHEINNPLMFVAANVELLAERMTGAATGASDPEVLEMLSDARDGCQRVRTIVNELRGLAGGQPPSRVPIDLRAVAEKAMKMTVAEIRPRARLERALCAIPLVSAAERQLHQVFVNLLINAAHAIPEGDAEANEVRLTTRYAADADEVVVEVRDTGCGMAPEVLSRIFEPFFTTKGTGRGTGLGLAITRSIVHDSGGRLEVESEPGVGSVFRVVLPAVPAPTVAKKAPAAPPDAELGEALSLFVIDDESLVAQAVARVLRRHRVEVFTDPRRAIARLQEGARPDVILCDLMMPDMTGMEVHAVLAQRFPELLARMVFVTGGACTSEAQGFLRSTAVRCVEKPVDPRTLRTMIEEMGGHRT